MTVAKGLSSGYLPISASIFGDRLAEVLMDRPGGFRMVTPIRAIRWRRRWRAPTSR
jgi:hypothetical protein